MKLTKLGAVAVFAIATLATPLYAETQAAPSALQAVSASHAQDLRDLMIALRTFQVLKNEPSDWAQMSAPRREFDAAFRHQMTEEETYRRLMPGYAAVITAKQAADMARLTRSTAWRKREKRLQELKGASVYLSTFMTPAEITETRRIDMHPAMAALQGHRKSLHQVHQQVADRWASQFSDQLSSKLVTVLRKVKSDLAAGREANTTGAITIGRVGVSYYDKFAFTSGSALIKMDNAYNAFENTMKHLGFEDILKPEYLASKVSVAHSRTVVDETERALEVLLKDVDAAIKERDAQLRTIELPQQAESSRSIENATGNAYAFMVEFGESNRRVLEDHRRLLAFVAERSGAVQFKDGQLLFASDADLNMAKDLFNKLDASRAEVDTIIERQQQKELDAERRQRGERAATEPSDKS